MLTWKKIASTLLYLAGFYLISLTVHEFFHYITVIKLDGAAFITYNWYHGYTTWAIPNAEHNWIVQLSGGLFTGIFLLVFFWFLPFLSKTKHDTNLEVSAFAYGLGNILYAPSEILIQHNLIGASIFAIGFIVAGFFYITKISTWIYE